MNDLIGFIAALGEGPARTPAQLREAVEGARFDTATRDVLLGRDPAALGRLLGGRAAMWCATMTPEETPGERDEPRREEPARDDPQPDTEEA